MDDEGVDAQTMANQSRELERLTSETNLRWDMGLNNVGLWYSENSAQHLFVRLSARTSHVCSVRAWIFGQLNLTTFALLNQEIWSRSQSESHFEGRGDSVHG